MSATLDRVRRCVAAGAVQLTRHGSKELDNDGLALDEVLASVPGAEIVEDYAEAGRGPSVLALHTLRDGAPVHVVWAFFKDTERPAVLVTAYRPEPKLWSPDFMRRSS